MSDVLPDAALMLRKRTVRANLKESVMLKSVDKLLNGPNSERV